jgi:hypothetical protein
MPRPKDPDQVLVDFSEPLNPITAEVETKYVISDGVAVSGASLSADSREPRSAVSATERG